MLLEDDFRTPEKSQRIMTEPPFFVPNGSTFFKF
jgi:hypothetical protein